MKSFLHKLAVAVTVLSLSGIGVFGRLRFNRKHAASSPSNNPNHEEVFSSFGVQPKNAASESTTSKRDTVKNVPPYGQQGLCKSWLPKSACHSHPMYPDHVRNPDFVSSVARVPRDQEEQFKAQYINRTKVSFRKHPATTQDQREIMYSRFDWACKNIETLVNMMRISGIEDQAIKDMFDGLPLCWPNQELFDSFRDDLSHMAKVLEAAVGFRDVHFVHSGSSANGFSQSPYKGSRDVPSWISNPLNSDVDIVIIAHGVRDFVSQNKEHFIEFEAYHGKKTAKRLSIGMVRAGNEDDYYNRGNSMGMFDDAYSPLSQVGRKTTKARGENEERGRKELYDDLAYDRPIKQHYDYSCQYDHCTGLANKSAGTSSYVRLYAILGDEFGAFWKKWEDLLGKPIQFIIADTSEHSVLPEWEIVLEQTTQASSGASPV